MAERTIDLTIGTEPVQREAIADGAVTPGMLLRLQSTGKMKANATASKRIPAAVAVENKLFGKEIDTAYSDADRLFYKTFRPGDRIYMILDSGESIVKGDKLVPSTAGQLKEATAGVDDFHIMFQAEEAVDTSTLTSTSRIIVSAV